MKKQRKSRGLGITFIIVCLVLSGCGAGTQEAALGSAEEYVQRQNGNLQDRTALRRILMPRLQ